MSDIPPPPLPPPVQVMGLLQGKVQNDTFVVIDSFALPVEGTETRVNAQAEAYEYMVDFQGTSKVRPALCRAVNGGVPLEQQSALPYVLHCP